MGTVTANIPTEAIQVLALQEGGARLRKTGMEG
jgi:hypothetical protein